MLTIRKAQMDAFTLDLLIRFKERLLRRFTALYPEHFFRLHEEGMKGLIDHGIEMAGRYHIDTERDVAEFINFALKTTGDIDAMIQSEPVRGILESDSFSGQSKVQLLNLQLKP